MLDASSFGHVTILGDVMLDRYVIGSVHRISPEAPVPVVLCTQQRAVPGGAANVAVNAATLGCRTALVGVVGNDGAASELRKALEETGIDTSGLVIATNRPTTTKSRVLSDQQQIVRIDEEDTSPMGADVLKRVTQQVLNLLEQTDILICSDYAKGVLGEDVLRTVIEAARIRGVPVVVDPKRKDLSVYHGATLITPNRKELHDATGLPLRSDEEVLAAAAAASRQFGGDVLVTRSEDGMTLWRRDSAPVHVHAANKAEVSDVSGAGDTVIATLAAILSSGRDLKTAVSIATAAAGISVRKLGTATVTCEELNRELRWQNHNDADPLALLPEAAERTAYWRHHGARVVFTNGCFDLLHPGHLALLRAAAQQGDKLVVGINSDASVQRLKGPQRPVQDEGARAEVLSALRFVDMVVIFGEDTPLETIQALRPDVVVKGADYTVEQVVGGAFVQSYGGEVVLVDLEPGRSTSSLVRKMQAPT